jgi:hypothetical protein
MKKIFLFIVVTFIILSGLQSQEYPYYYFQYTNLYPDCVDEQPAEVYDLNTPWLEEPVFPGGGQVQMTRYVHLYSNVLDVKDANGEQLKGRVLVSAVIDRCGDIGNLEVIQSLSDEHDAEALRVIESFPVFKPGVLDGVRVKVAMIIPVYFTRTFVPGKHNKPKSTDSEDYEYEYDYDDSEEYDYTPPSDNNNNKSSDDDWGDWF